MAIIFAAILYLLMKTILLALAIGVGLLLHWIFPEVDFGIAILIGLLATLGTILLYIRGFAAVNEFEEDRNTEVVGDPDDPGIIYQVSPFPKPRRRKRKPRRNP